MKKKRHTLKKSSPEKDTPPGGSNGKGFVFLTMFFFVVVGGIIYSNTLTVPFQFDDTQNISRNPHIRLTELSPAALLDAAFRSACPNRPVANISFAFNYYFHQYELPGYHLVNIVVHIVTGVLLTLLITTLLGLPAVGNGHMPHRQIAFFAAMLWLVHPLHTQSVTYVVQRMTSMAAMFYILSLLLYVKGRLVKRGQRRWPWFAGCVCAGLLALGAKEIAATLPFFILLFEWYFFQDLAVSYLRRIFPYLIGSLLVFVVLALLYLGPNPLQTLSSGYANRDFTMAQRVLTEFRVVIHYITLLVYPNPSRLNLDYDFSLSRSLVDPLTTPVAAGLLLCLTGWTFFAAKRHRLLSFCIIWFVGNLAIESSVVALEIVYEHRTYLPSMMFFVPVVAFVFKKLRSNSRIAVVVTGMIALLLCYWTYDRNGVWNDPVVLWRDCVKKSPGKARPYNNLGLALFEQGKYEEAAAYYLQALSLKPAYAEAHNNLGNALEAQERLEEAIGHYEEALRMRPNFAEAHNNLGNALVAKGKRQEALEHLRRALEISPGFAKAHNNLGNALAMEGKVEEAIAHYAEALRIMPDYAKAHNNLGNALAVEGRLEEAAAHFQEALRIEPDYVMAQENLYRLQRRMNKADRGNQGAAGKKAK